MKTAIEIANITNEACKKLLAERHTRTMDYINGAMSRQVEEAAKRGDYSIKFRVSENIDRDTIERVFVSAGYHVTIKGYDVNVSWLDQCVKLRT